MNIKEYWETQDYFIDCAFADKFDNYQKIFICTNFKFQKYIIHFTQLIIVAIWSQLLL